MRRHQRQGVTGLVVNAKVQLPRALRRRLRAIEHHLRMGRPATLTEPVAPTSATWRPAGTSRVRPRRTGTPIAGSISDRSGRKQVLTAGLFSTSIVLFVLAYFQMTWLFITGLAILGFFLYAVRPVIWAWVLDLSPKELGGSMVSFFSGSQSLLSSLSPLICGFIADRWGILTAFYFLAGTVLLANLVVLAIREPQPKAPALVEELA